jgi:hypothetical protein
MFTLVSLIRLNDLIENAAAQRRIDSWRPTPAAALRAQILMQVSLARFHASQNGSSKQVDVLLRSGPRLIVADLSAPTPALQTAMANGDSVGAQR